MAALHELGLDERWQELQAELARMPLTATHGELASLVERMFPGVDFPAHRMRVLRVRWIERGTRREMILGGIGIAWVVPFLAWMIFGEGIENHVRLVGFVMGAPSVGLIGMLVMVGGMRLMQWGRVVLAIDGSGVELLKKTLVAILKERLESEARARAKPIGDVLAQRRGQRGTA